MSTVQNPNDEIARLTIVLYANGSMGIGGNVGDAALATRMLDSAKEAVGHKLARELKKPIIVSSQDVEVKHDARYPVTPVGDRR